MATLACLTLAGCFATPTKKVTVYQNEGFQADETYSRLFDASPAAACEAARRALLGHGQRAAVQVDVLPPQPGELTPP